MGKSKGPEEFNPDCAFVEWRGRADDHRENDVMISSDDKAAMIGLVGMANRWRDVGDPGVRGKLKRAGLVISAGAVNADDHSEACSEDLSRFVVTTGEGPKFAVDPDYVDPPTIMSRVRANTLTAARSDSRVGTLAKAIAEKLDELVDWGKVRRRLEKHHNQMRVVLFKFPKSEFPPYEGFGEGSRYNFWRNLISLLGQYVKHESRLGKDFHFDDLQPRITGNNIEFHAFADWD